MGGRGSNTNERNSVKDIGDYSSAQKYFDKESTRWEKSLTDDETDALIQYTAGEEGTYDLINNALYGYGELGELESQVEFLDRAISKFDLKENVVVYRGTEGADLDLSKGSIITQSGYSSTSTDLKVAEAYATNSIDWEYEKPVVLKISVPKGRGNAAYVANYAMAPEESEVLLRRNSRIQITGSRKYKDYILVEAKML